MAQKGQDPHGNVLMNYQRLYHLTQSCKLSMSTRTLAINWSMSQPGHNPNSYNPVN